MTIFNFVTGVADRLLHMLTEERDEKVLNAVTASLQALSKTHSKQIVQNMIHYKLQNSVPTYLTTYDFFFKV